MDLDNGPPGVVLRILKTNNDDTISFLAHVDTCVAMNIGNPLLHRYIITKHPSLVAEFIQYDGADTFYPIILKCAVTDLVKEESAHRNLTVIFLYWTPYTCTDGKPLLISFGIRSGVTVRSIIRLPTIFQWGL